MSSVERAGPSKQAAGSHGRWQPPPKPKREQISVACNNCRQRKSKCNGERPSCKLCRDRQEVCEYTSEPGISPIASLKRKYESLQAESADEHDLLGLLRTVPEGDAIKVLAYLRSSDDIQSTLYQARNSLDSLGESLGKAASDMPPLRPVDRPATQPDSQATTDPIDAPSIYPELSESNGRVPWALPIEPLETSLNGENTLQRKIIRRTPSVPELSQSRERPIIGLPKNSVARSDPRLNNATTERWGITFISDDNFRKVMTSYIVWEHPCFEIFDISDFCKALSGETSELASKLLVMAVLAFALRQYVNFDPEVGYNYSTARDETERLWQESLDKEDDSIATAAAGGLVYLVYGSDGLDRPAAECLSRAQQILLDKGLFDPRLVDQAYNSYGPVGLRTRAAVAWGVLQLASNMLFYVKTLPLLLEEPPVPVPVPSIGADMDEWSPWPVTRPRLMAHTYESNLARARLWAIVRDMLHFQKKQGAAAMDTQYLDAVQAIYARYQDWMSSLDQRLQSCELVPQQHILLLTLYNFAVFELFRPVVTQEVAEGSNNVEGRTPPAFATAARAASIKALTQLLVRREALYGGLGISSLFASPSLAVVFDALPTASPASPGYTPSAHMASLIGLRTLMHVARGIHTVYYAVLGVQQAAARMALTLPMEAEDMFKEAVKGLENSRMQKKGVSSDWVVDFSRPAVDDDDSRLSSLVEKMDDLKVGGDK